MGYEPCGSKDARCGECCASISDNEFVMNWGSCDPCFNKHFDKYMRSLRMKRIGKRIAVWLTATAIATGLFLGAGKIVGFFLALCSNIH